MVLDLTCRVLVVAIGIPTVWVLRHYEVVALTPYQAAGISIGLLLLALGGWYAAAALW
ncbi:Uncharacterised protein [Mycobacteroides abscessus subsp. abscessus]|jgi:hypothetical protein|nr:Uncharacterised protein [Mycobacteroides abscessus subsp. abscessus]